MYFSTLFVLQVSSCYSGWVWSGGGGSSSWYLGGSCEEVSVNILYYV
jgi:hypothetical protein